MFIILGLLSFASSFFSVSGGNGLIMFPVLLAFGFKLSYIIPLLRVTAVVFILMAITSGILAKKRILPYQKDLPMIIIICISSFLAAHFIHFFSEEMLEIIVFLVICVFFVAKLNTTLFTFISTNILMQIIICIFAGICAALFGGAGVLITIILLSKGLDPFEVLSRRLFASFLAQVSALSVFIFHGHIIIDNIFYIVVISSGIGIFLSTSLSYKLKGRFSQSLVYISITISLVMIFFKITGIIS